MSYVGHANISSNLSFVVVTNDNNGEPADSTFIPTFDILLDGETVVTGKDVTKLAATTGMYLVDELISRPDGFSPGNVYQIILDWSYLSQQRRESFSFSVT